LGPSEDLFWKSILPEDHSWPWETSSGSGA
jgi:hypothetical protein